MFSVCTQPNDRHSGIETKRGLSSLVFSDATTSNRIGFRGTKAAAFLEQHNVSLPDKPNRAVQMSDGLLVLRLSHTEYWLVDADNLNTTTLSNLEKASEDTSDVIRLYCQHSVAMFVLSGPACPQMFAKVCAVDLQLDAFDLGSIAQTSVARVSSIVVRAPTTKEQETCFYIFSDISSASYLWHALDDAAAEF
ncbi:hypothetical protein [Veronia pacifica]|uniref:GCVT N-terminal domain-containing protein n=1 Tax=Veronia pacifica TaxID=1080227 RepID=A0A1C3ER27_9GAMM|nr:hypothetical protein [Veronia pacifica]ODA35687.1 hypothetical protein A8L45_03475 [Veronia pacifica]